MDKYLFFIGKGKGTLVGVPARDLSYDEAKKYGITNLLASGLYVYNSSHAIPIEYREDLGLPVDKSMTRQELHQGLKEDNSQYPNDQEKIKSKKRSKKERE